MASRQTANKKFERKCEICGRSNRNERILGPLIHTQTISAHYNCVLFSPVTVDAISIASKSEDDGICGVTARFIRSEGNRAKKLVCSIFAYSCFGCIYLFISFNYFWFYLEMQLLQMQWSTHGVLFRYWNWFRFEILSQALPCRLWCWCWSIINCEQRKRHRFFVLRTSWPDREVKLQFSQQTNNDSTLIYKLKKKNNLFP